MVFTVTSAQDVQMGHILAGLDVASFATIHGLSPDDTAVLYAAQRTPFKDSYVDTNPNLTRAFAIVHACSPLLSAMRTSRFRLVTTSPLPQNLDPIYFLHNHLVAERERIRFHESPHSGPMREADLRFKPLALVALGYALQVLGDLAQAQDTYDLAEKAGSFFEPGPTAVKFENLLEGCKAGKWDKYLYYDLCEDFPGFIQTLINQADLLAQKGNVTESLDILLTAHPAFHADRARGLLKITETVVHRHQLRQKARDAQREPHWGSPQAKIPFTDTVRNNAHAFSQYLEAHFQHAGYDLKELLVDRPLPDNNSTNPSQVKVYRAIERHTRKPVILLWTTVPLTLGQEPFSLECAEHPSFPVSINRVLHQEELPYGNLSVLEMENDLELTVKPLSITRRKAAPSVNRATAAATSHVPTSAAILAPPQKVPHTLALKYFKHPFITGPGRWIQQGTMGIPRIGFHQWQPGMGVRS